ncbi:MULTISPECIES: GspH/FimT family pseudopilin [unclassified Acinetobacter]|uniref:GspH/FimT family pseudopilin n=1 Tax=unclassified Acinetobacter TaxID=196816 RepID=UPI0024469567|nr:MULTISPECIES: GspH/FimT family pseudopilin [unclassified Acinetobacter]MDH0029835.1 GspH/FimT family pseudopilin [Acinetobacter sp. GD04021]MDH0885401.1 GspH/FimT family pseudopilin [Acinetobacter sp. GD03873]MDH1081519.1 GspH/FimT family pseudopilin [Acinetobacter sp. GD03983]MDH2188700.1 GspH/FimT family pseudopilin [Acinetobacter sp. GD03645]MDH2203423.1 GspH/FimT family pseudopilin [Acinetobacter sp. GD03647]
MGKNRGFTLIELIVTIAILAIIVTLAAPSFGNMMTEQKLNASTRELALAINQAKSQAAMMKTTVALCLNKTNTDNDFTKDKCATAVVLPGYAAMSAAEKVKAQQNRVISVQIDSLIVVESTSAVGVLFTEIGSTTTATTIFSFCKSGKKREIKVTRFGNEKPVEGTC